MRAHFLSYHYPQWLRLMAAILVALVGLTLVNVTMAQSDASHTSADLSRGTRVQPTSLREKSKEQTVEFAAATGGIGDGGSSFRAAKGEQASNLASRESSEANPLDQLAALCYDNQISITPLEPTINDTIQITPSGTWCNLCVPTYDSHQITDHYIRIDAVSNPDGGPCGMALLPWGFTVGLGPLLSGNYTVDVYIARNGFPPLLHESTLFIVENIPTATPTPLPTNTPTATNTPPPTNTPINTPTSTNTPTYIPINTNTPTATNTPPPTNTPSSTNTPTPMPPPANSVMLALSPESVTTGLGKMVMLTIQVQAGTQEVDEAAAHLNFDPQDMRVLNVLPGHQFRTIILNQFDNDSGQLDFAAGSFNNFPSGSFTLATVFFQTTALTDEDGTPVEFNATLPRLSDVTFNSTSVLSATIDSTIFVEKKVILALEPPTLTTSVGQTFDLPILVEADSQAVEVASAYLNFDPTLMQVASITPGSDLSNVLTNSFDNTGGQIDFVADALDAPFPPFGTFTLATVTFTATNATTGTLVSFNTTAARNSDTTYNETSVLSDTKGSTITIVSAVLNGSVTLQGRPTPPDSRWVVPLRVSLTIPASPPELGGTEANDALPSEGGPPAYEFTPTTDENGEFTLTGIEAGTYEIRVKHAHTLQNMQTVTLMGGSNTSDLGTLREGDANNDNFITILDFSILAATFAKCEGTTGYDERADFNGDGCVTILDFSLLASNFGQGGQNAPQGPTPS